MEQRTRSSPASDFSLLRVPHVLRAPYLSNAWPLPQYSWLPALEPWPTAPTAAAGMAPRIWRAENAENAELKRN